MKMLFKMMKNATCLIGSIVSFCLFACDNETTSDVLKSGQIEIRVNPGKNNEVGFWAIADKITIDWGDGHVEQFAGNFSARSHTYANQDLKIITIKTEKLALFETMLESVSIDDERLTWGYFREMRFGEMPALARLTLGCPTLSVLEIKKASVLTHFNLRSQLTSFDFSGLTALEEFDCTGNQFTSLDLRSLHKLKYLSCGDNKLTLLDLRGLSALVSVTCVYNQLTTLHLTGCSSLGSLVCLGNQLTSLDIGSLTSLSNLSVHDNQLTTNALNNIFEQLPERIPGTAFLTFANNPGSDTCNREIAINKGWLFPLLD